jgi:hypothetical protein
MSSFSDSRLFRLVRTGAEGVRQRVGERIANHRLVVQVRPNPGAPTRLEVARTYISQLNEGRPHRRVLKDGR